MYIVVALNQLCLFLFILFYVFYYYMSLFMYVCFFAQMFMSTSGGYLLTAIYVGIPPFTPSFAPLVHSGPSSSSSADVSSGDQIEEEEDEGVVESKEASKRQRLN